MQNSNNKYKNYFILFLVISLLFGMGPIVLATDYTSTAVYTIENGDYYSNITTPPHQITYFGPVLLYKSADPTHFAVAYEMTPGPGWLKIKFAKADVENLPPNGPGYTSNVDYTTAIQFQNPYDADTFIATGNMP